MPTFGVSRRYAKDIETFLHTLHEHSVDAYEIGFAYGVPEDFPTKTAHLAEELSIKLSGHIPFFLSWTSEEKKTKSIRHIRRGIRFACKLRTIAVCHLGHYNGRGFEELKSTITRGISDALELANAKHDHPVLGIETTGRQYEIGTVDEVLSVVGDLPSKTTIPVIDWAHIFARSDGRFPRGLDDFRKLLTRLENEVGIERFYFHGSGIEYQNGQEKRHLGIKTCRPPLPYLFQALNEANYDYTFIVETPSAIEDLVWIRHVSKDPKSWFDFAEKRAESYKAQKQIGLSNFL